ncbi:MAG TPA: T9SS type A sorting domain-containing protein [Chitinophagales bacterium]|nr:T9SS type A sorting domain-containing protein [Chitinophagales bacterium]
MRGFFLLSGFVLLHVFATPAAAQSGTFHQFKAETITGDTLDMMQFWGKKVMVVNTASFCGYTPQFEELQALYEQYNQYNFEIIGFPCNNFGNQDPGSDSAILFFCTANYGVTFQMMSKVDIVSGDTAPVYKWLQRADLNGVQNASVGWNFNKFLIDEAGHWVDHFGSATNPLAPVITNWIMSPSVMPPGTAPLDQDDAQYENATLATSLNDIVHEAAAPANVSVFGADGRLVKEMKNIDANAARLAVENGLPAGLYVVVVRSNNAVRVTRLAVTR